MPDKEKNRLSSEPVERILSRLEGVKDAGQGKWQARCPAHDDKKPSLSITVGEDGRVLLFCHAGCSIKDVCKAMGLSEKDLFTQKLRPPSRKKEIVARYDYRDETGKLLYQAVRERPKRFWQRQSDGKGGWVLNLKGVRRVLYRLPELVKADSNEWIHVVEGEKDADRLAGLGLTATTSPMGAGKWQDSYAEFLTGRKVAIVPDNDEPGQKHGEVVARSLHGKASDVRIVRLDNVPLGGDVSDWLANGGTVKKLAELVESAEKYQPSTDIVSPMGGDIAESIPYGATPGGLMWYKSSKDGPVPILLTNFAAEIVADVITDDGIEQSHIFEMKATRAGKTTSFAVPAGRFGGMNWVIEHLGAQAMIYPGFALKDHARAAIQLLSSDITTRVMYTHTGWRLIDDTWYFLHAAGAIGPKDSADQSSAIETGLVNNLSHYSLPAVPDDNAVREAIHASLRLLELLPETISYPLFCLPWLAVLGPCTFSVHLAGHTGTGKTQMAALIQQHFGKAMDGSSLPGSWSSTGNSLEGLAFLAKDVVLVIDDFAPTGSQNDIKRYHRDADRVFRAQGNRSARQRMRSDGSLRGSKPPRGLILSTGEDVPRGQSLRARCIILELGQDDMNWPELTNRQMEAADGQYAQAMTGYLAYLAPRYDELRENRPEKLRQLRQKATQSSQHRRTPEIVAELMLGLEHFLEYAQEVGAITSQQANDLHQQGWNSLVQAASSQGAHQAANDPVQRFLELVCSAIASGRAHIADPKGNAPEDAAACGWRFKTIGTGGFTRGEWQPQGDRIGWVDDECLYLEPDASYKVAQSMAGNAGDGLAVAARTLRKRLHERGLLTTEGKREALTVRRTLEGTQRKVLQLHKSVMSQEPDKPDKPDNDGGSDTENAVGCQVSMSGSATDDDQNLTNKPDKNPPETPKNEGECHVCQECQVSETSEANSIEADNEWGEV